MQNFRFSFDLFRGCAGFQPVDFELRVTPEFNINYVLARENGLTVIDVRARSASHRHQRRHAGTVRRKAPVTPNEAYFDFTSRARSASSASPAISAASSSPTSSPARASSAPSTTTSSSTIWRTSTCWRRTPTAASTAGGIGNQSVYAANLYWSDFLTKGYNLNFSALYNNDQPSFLVDKNGFLVRPAPVGLPAAAQGPRRLCRASPATATSGASTSRTRSTRRSDATIFNPIPARNNRAAHQRAAGRARSLRTKRTG